MGINKLTMIAVLFLIIFALVFGCSKTAPTTTPSQTPTQPAPTTPTEPATPITFKVTSTLSETNIYRIAIDNLMANFKKRAGDRIKYDYYPQDSLVKMPDAFETISEGGIVDFGMTCYPFEADKMGLAAASMHMPFLLDPYKITANYRKAGFDQIIQSYLDEHNLKSAMFMGSSSGDLVTSERAGQVKSLEDLKGKVISCAKTEHEALKLLGASPVDLGASADLYEGVQRGVADGVFYGAAVILGDKLYEVTKYYTAVNAFVGNMAVVINMDVYNGLPADLREMFDESCLEAEAQHVALLKPKTEETMSFLKDQGLVIYTLPADERARWSDTVMPTRETVKTEYGDLWTKFEKEMYPSFK